MKLLTLLLCGHGELEMIEHSFCAHRLADQAVTALEQTGDPRHQRQAIFIRWALSYLERCIPDLKNGCYVMAGEPYDSRAEEFGFVNWPQFHLVVSTISVANQVHVNGAAPPNCGDHLLPLVDWTITFSPTMAIIRGMCPRGHEYVEESPSVPVKTE